METYLFDTHTSCVNTIGSGRNSCVIRMVLFLASLEGIRRHTSCSVWWWHLSILIRDVTQSDRHALKTEHALKNSWLYDKGNREVETPWKRHGRYVCVCIRPSRPRGTEAPSPALLFNRRIQGTSRTLKTTRERSLSHTLSRPVYPFWCLPADLWYLVLVMSQPTLRLWMCVCVFIAHTHAQRQGAKGHNNIVSTRRRQSCSNAVWGAVGWMIWAHTLIQLVGRGCSRPANAQRSGQFTGHHSWQPILGCALLLQCQGWVPTCESFQMPQKCVCLNACTRSHTVFWGWMLIIGRTFEW